MAKVKVVVRNLSIKGQMVDGVLKVQKSIGAMYAEIDGVFVGQLLRCKECGHEMPINPGEGAEYTRRGWPKHCGKTMQLHKPE